MQRCDTAREAVQVLEAGPALLWVWRGIGGVLRGYVVGLHEKHLPGGTWEQITLRELGHDAALDPAEE
jgi:hypothetical protein